MTAGRKHLPELSLPERTLSELPDAQVPPRQLGLALQTVAESTAGPSRTPVFAQALSYRKRQFMQRDLRSRTNARGRVR